MTRHQSPELPDLELHSPEKATTEFESPMKVSDMTEGLHPLPAFDLVSEQPDLSGDPIPAPPQHPAPQSAWGPKGNEFARFTLSGDCKVTIYHPAPGIKTIAVEVETGCEPFVEGAPDTRRQTVLQLPKARARALASAIMGAAAEL